MKAIDLNEKTIPSLDLLSNGLFRVTKQITVFLDVDASLKKAVYIVIREGTMTNFGSIPTIARRLVSPIDPKACLAFLVHDFLVSEYIGAGENTSPPCLYIADYVANEDGSLSLSNKEQYDSIVDWKQSASCARKLMLNKGMPVIRRQLIYVAIRAYGLFKQKSRRDICQI